MENNKIFLCIVFAITKFINIFYIFTEKYGIFVILLFLILNKLSMSQYIIIVFLTAYISLKLYIKINNVLCIGKITHSINMNFDINIRKLIGKRKSWNSIYLLNKLVDEFVDGLSEVALNPKKYKVKEGRMYKFRTHGAVYALFQRKLIKMNDGIFIYDKDSVDMVVRKAGHHTAHKFTFSDKLTFIVERMLIQRSFSQMLNFFSNLKLNEITSVNFEVEFKAKKVYLKIVD